MFQGTGSDVGKSILVAGLCRALYNRGKNVRPFKPQNMSNNAAVTSDGGEIGRAQALQAKAAKAHPNSHMNPVLLKPQTDIGSQIIVQGRLFGHAQARDYYKLKPKLLEKVIESFKVIKKEADVVLVEGAGSPAEVNLRAGDIANMGFALAANVPVVLIADIERGGVIASLIGTFEVLTMEAKDKIKGFIINKFRGDKTLFKEAIEIIYAHTGWQCFGIVPFLEHVRSLPQEDAMALDKKFMKIEGSHVIKIVVPRLSRIANFDDLDPLRSELDVNVEVIDSTKTLPVDADIILIPGTKSTLSDLKYIRDCGWDIDILSHHRRGGLIVGICGGFQILGAHINDPEGIEGIPGEAKGLGLLDISTVIEGEKALKEVNGKDIYTKESFVGYEMHIGKTFGDDLNKPWLQLSDGRLEGATSSDGSVLGSYIHGLFVSDQFRASFLNRVRSGRHSQSAYEIKIEEVLDQIGVNLEENIDIDSLISL